MKTTTMVLRCRLGVGPLRRLPTGGEGGRGHGCGAGAAEPALWDEILMTCFPFVQGGPTGCFIGK